MSQYQKLIKIMRIMDILFIDRSKEINKIMKAETQDLVY